MSPLALLREFAKRFLGRYGQNSFSQEGEDIILLRELAGAREGIYVDIGAHHPQRFSNTEAFSRRGWSGTNVEPNPDLFRLFGLFRRRDLNLNLAVGSDTSGLTYRFYDEPALNTCSADRVRELETLGHRAVSSVHVPTVTLAEIFTRTLKHFGATQIDLVNVDVEGLDLEVLKSNDWSRFQPRYFICESHAGALEDHLQSELHAFMKSQGYELWACTGLSVLYRMKKGS